VNNGNDKIRYTLHACVIVIITDAAAAVKNVLIRVMLSKNAAEYFT